MLINPKGSPLLHFSVLCNFFWKSFFSIITSFFPKKNVLRFLSLRYGADFRRSRLVFSSDYNPHTDRSTFLTILTILKSYNSYLANLKYWRKSLRSSIFSSSKKLKGTKGYLFFRKIFNVSKGSPLRVFSYFATECMLINPKGSPLLHFWALCDFF